MSAHAPRPRGRSANIFLSYRREDSAGHAGRLFDSLSHHFSGRLFMDVDALEPGVDFVDAIEQAVGSCEVLIVVIGREWLTLRDAAGHRRLDNPDDFVRLEVESALARKIRVIPVLVEEAPRPRAEDLPASLAALARRNAIELSDDRWAYDVDRLAQTIQQILEDTGASQPVVEAPPPVPSAPVRATAKLVTLMHLLCAVVLMWAVVRLPAVRTGLNPIGGPSVAPDRAPIQTPGDGGKATDQTAKGPSNEGSEARGSPGVKLEEKPERHKPSVPAEASKKHVESPANEPQVAITSPKNGSRVGERFAVRGTASGLGAGYRAFLCFRQPGELMFESCVEIPSMDDGLFALTVVGGSKGKTFEVLVVIAPNGEAAEALSDRGNWNNGLRGLPPGAKIKGSMALNRLGRISNWLKRGR